MGKFLIRYSAITSLVKKKDKYLFVVTSKSFFDFKICMSLNDSLYTDFVVVSECQFGKQAKELGSTWFADLGPPFGVMYCIKCECIPVSK